MVREGERRRDCRPGSASFSQGRFSCRGNGLFQCCRGLSSCREGSPPDFRRKSRKSGASCGLHCRDAGRLFFSGYPQGPGRAPARVFLPGSLCGCPFLRRCHFCPGRKLVSARFPEPFQFETRCVSDPAARCFAEKRCFQSGPGGAVPPPSRFTFFKVETL